MKWNIILERVSLYNDVLEEIKRFEEYEVKAVSVSELEFINNKLSRLRTIRDRYYNGIDKDNMDLMKLISYKELWNKCIIKKKVLAMSITL